MAKIKNKTKNKPCASEGAEQLELSYTEHGKTVCQFLPS